MITLLHGPAELLRTEELQKIIAKAGDEELVELNTVRLDGRTVGLGEIQNACDTMPFLADQRLVIVDGLLARLAGAGKTKARGGETDGGEAETAEAAPADDAKGLAKAFYAYLDHVPESAQLVLVEDDFAGSAALRRLQELSRGGKARIVSCEKPRKNDLPNWIRERARLRKVRLDPAAVTDLADFVGDELRQLDQELIKLADYANGRPVTREDVQRLVPATRAANVFDMVDALGNGNAPQAARLMRHALDVDGDQPLRLIGLIAWHYRQVIQVKALQARGAKAAEIAHEVNVGEWKVPKLVNQANRLSFPRLESALERLLAADEAIKTGRLTDREAMDVLLAELV